MTTKPIVCRQVVYLFILTLGLGEGQKLPTLEEDDFHLEIHYAEIFYDTKSLPNGAEVTTYMHAHTPRRFYFMVEEESEPPLAIIVTPCRSVISWNISIQDLPEENSGYNPGDDDPLQLQLLSTTQSHPSSHELSSYRGNDVETYRTSASPVGLYVLTLESEGDGSVRMYATTTPHSDHPYPQLPADSVLDVVDVGRHDISIAWKPSPTASVYGQPVVYCLAVNTRRPYRTQCAALTDIYGDVPPTAPPNAGFGFAWEKERRNRTTQRRRGRARKSRQRDYANYECIGEKTTYTITDLQPGKRYGVNVFAVNTLTNRSTAYSGLTQSTKPNNKKTRIRDGKVVTTFIKRNDGHKLFRYKRRSSTKELIIALQPCFGELQVDISRGGDLLERRVVDNYEQIMLTNVSRGVYLIKVSTLRRASAYFNIFVTWRRHKSPFPELPADTNIKVFERQRKCRSLTVGWLATDTKTQYCLFAKELEENEDSLSRLVKGWNKCMTPGGRKNAEKVKCRNVRFKETNRGVVTQRIRGLKPNTRYILDVYATKTRGRGQSLLYQTTETRTSAEC